MQIKDIFQKDIFRPINGVVKVDQLNEEIVWQELDEYVVTRELDQYFRKFFEVYLSAIDTPHDPVLTGRIGIWVSGFFGSGKSHFIKILSYLLGSRDAFNKETDTTKSAIEFFKDKIKDQMLFADLKRSGQYDTDVILFNIDSRADPSEGKSAILSVFWKVFNEIQGYCAEYPHIAELERYLVSRGRYEDFCKNFKDQAGAEWVDKRDAYLLMQDEIVNVLSDSLGMSISAAEKWFDKAEQEFSLTIKGFVKRVKEYLDTKPPGHRIVFLVDEIGQFIGDDSHLMLNLQTITEELGRVCQGQAWILVTSQEDIDAVVGDLKASKANDFSKIQGRFNTRLSLSSSNTDEVIQTRLLTKQDIAKPELENLFNEKGDILKNQLSFSADSATMKNYTDADDFVSNYPFVPYHFQLLQKIFESIRKAGATGLHLSRGERSMLDAFQSAAKNVSEKNIGTLVPLYEFFPCIESFLDTSVKKSIDQAKDNTGLKIPFDIYLLQTLFLIRYVDIIKPNVENLVTLCITEVDADRLTIKREIEESLQRLEHQNLISRNGDLYFFLTNEERDVSREIKNVDIASAEETKLLGELIFEEILKGSNKHRYKDFGRDYSFNKICDDQHFGSKGDYDLAIEVITPFYDEYSIFGSERCILHSANNSGHVLLRLPENKGLDEIRTFLQTDKYIRLKSDAAAPTTYKQILSTRQEENRQRKDRLITLLEEMMISASYFGLGKKLEISGTKATASINEALDYLVLNIFSKFNYLKSIHENPVKEIKAILLTDDIGHQQIEMEFQKAESEDIKEIRTYIELKIASDQPVLLKEMVNHFSKRPYGWPEWEIVILTARLFVGGMINLVVDGAKIQPKAAVDPLTKTGQWKNVKIVKRIIPPEAELKKARELGKEMFGSIGPDRHDKLVQFLKDGLSGWKVTLSSFKPLADTGNYPGKKEIDECLSIIKKIKNIHDASEFIKSFNKNKDDLKNVSDNLYDLSDFYKNQKQTWESLLKAIEKFKPNQSDLEKNPDASKALRRMDEIYKAPRPYGMLKEVAGLISAVESINDALVKAAKKSTIEIIDNKVKQIHDLLDEKKADPDLRNKALYPIQNIKKKIQTDYSIPNITYQIRETQEQFEEAVEVIEKGGRKKPKSLKPVKEITPASFSSKIYLETEEDINDFLDKLKEELITAIKNNMRIRIL